VCLKKKENNKNKKTRTKIFERYLNYQLAVNLKHNGGDCWRQRGEEMEGETSSSTTDSAARREEQEREKRWSRIIKGLSTLRYPLVHSLYSMTTYLTAGEPRYRLLEWLFQRFFLSFLSKDNFPIQPYASDSILS